MEDMKKVSTFSERLDLIINQTSRRPADIAREAALSRTTVARYLSGEYLPSPRTLVRIAKVLNVSDLWLSGFDVPMERSSKQDADAPAAETLSLNEDTQKQTQAALALVGQVLLDSDLLRLVEQYLLLPEEDQLIVKLFMRRLTNGNKKTP